MPFFISVVLALLLVGAPPIRVEAAPHETCIVYSNDAVRKATEAIRLGCGFSGPVWSTDPAGHMRWCLGANEESVAHEKSERANALEACDFCATYANTAVIQAGENIRLQCGFVGPRWQTDRSGHLGWCMGLEHKWGIKGHAEPEEYERFRALNECQCRYYADKAANSANQNIASNCGFSGARWVTDRAAHYQWCVQFGSQAGKAETEARLAMLQQCGPKQGAKSGRALGRLKTGGPPPEVELPGRAVAAQGFVGTWDTQVTPGGSFSVTFAQEGNRVKGEFSSGALEGTLEGADSLNFIVTFQSAGSGSGRLTLTQGGNAFDGRLTLEADPGRVRMWTGMKR